MLWCTGVGAMEEFRAAQICVSEHQCGKREQAGSLQEFRHSGRGILLLLFLQVRIISFYILRFTFTLKMF